MSLVKRLHGNRAKRRSQIPIGRACIRAEKRGKEPANPQASRTNCIATRQRSRCVRHFSIDGTRRQNQRNPLRGLLPLGKRKMARILRTANVRREIGIKKCAVSHDDAFLVVGFSEFCLISKRRVKQTPNTKHPKRNNNWRRHKSPPAPN
jgi:hypothetical protein